MPQKKRKSLVDNLTPAECAQVLCALLERHADLHEEANELAAGITGDVSVEAVCKQIAYLVGSIGIDEIGDRAGEHSNGYVEPHEAAWELLEESIEPIRADMKRRVEAGMKPAAEKICQGIVIGLHAVDDTDSDGVLEWASEFPAEAAAWSLSLLLDLYPQNQRRAAGKRVVKGVEARAESWVEMLEEVVGESAAKKQQRKRR